MLPGVALAQGGDLAVAACEMLVREDMPSTSTYRPVSEEIAGSTVVLSYETEDATGRVVKQQMRCAFTFNASTASWGFAPGMATEALQVAVMGALAHRGNYPIPRDMTALRAP